MEIMINGELKEHWIKAVKVAITNIYICAYFFSLTFKAMKSSYVSLNVQIIYGQSASLRNIVEKYAVKPR